jgi:hypothetical protein
LLKNALRIHVARKAQRDVGHVQEAVMKTADSFD